MDGLLQHNLATQQLLYLPHTVTNYQLQLLFLKMKGLHLPAALLGFPPRPLPLLLRSHGTGQVAPLLVIGRLLLHMFDRNMLTLLNIQISKNLVFLPQLLQNLISGSLRSPTLLGEGGLVRSIPAFLLPSPHINVTRLHLLDPGVWIATGLPLPVGWHVLVHFLVGLFHLYFGTGQHQLINQFELCLTIDPAIK